VRCGDSNLGKYKRQEKYVGMHCSALAWYLYFKEIDKDFITCGKLFFRGVYKHGCFGEAQ
jgi:hypothetical protein